MSGAWGPLPSERVLRSLMKSIAERLKPGNKLSAKQVMGLLKEHQRLVDQLQETVTAKEKAKREEQVRNTATAEVKNGLKD